MRYVEQYVNPDEIPRINESVRGTHKSVIKVWGTQYDPAQWKLHPMVDPTGWTETKFKVISGEVTETLGEAITRELSLSVASDYWDDPFDILVEATPYKSLIAVARGIETVNGEQMLVPLGVYRLHSVTTSGNAETGYELGVTGYSMEADIREARFLKTPIAGVAPGEIGQNVMLDILQYLVEEAFPKSISGNLVPFRANTGGQDLDYVFPPGSVLTDDRERLDLILEYQEANEVWGRFDRDNSYVIDDMPSPADTPIDFVINGDEAGVLMRYDMEFTREEVYNAVLAFGEYAIGNLKLQASYLAKDMDVLSPTYWEGPFGQVPMFHRVEFLPNNTAGANNTVIRVANNLLRRKKDYHSAVNFETVPNPLIEAGDVVELRYPVNPTLTSGASAGQEFLSEFHLIRSITIGLGADTSFSAETVANGETSTVLKRLREPE